MNYIDRFFVGAFGLIALYLILSPNSRGAISSLFDGAAKFNTATFKTLQGR